MCERIKKMGVGKKWKDMEMHKREKREKRYGKAENKEKVKRKGGNEIENVSNGRKWNRMNLKEREIEGNRRVRR